MKMEDEDFVSTHVAKHVAEDTCNCPLCDEGIRADDPKLGKLKYRGCDEEAQHCVFCETTDGGIAAHFVYDKAFCVKITYDEGKTWTKMEKVRRAK